jgi:hypothetical protein
MNIFLQVYIKKTPEELVGKGVSFPGNKEVSMVQANNYPFRQDSSSFIIY